MINSPTEISNCIVWLDGSDISTMGELSSTGVGDVVDGDPVGLWQNKVSPFDKDFSSEGFADSTRPTYVSSVSALRFNNAQYLTYLGSISYTQQTVFVVNKPSLIQNTDRVYSQAAAGATDSVTYTPLFYSGTTNLAAFTSNLTRAATPHRGNNFLDIYAGYHSGTVLSVSVNGGGTSGNSFAHTLGTFNTTCSRIGANISNGTTGAGGLFQYSGDIVEVIVYDRALNAQEYSDVHYYLTRKWNVLETIPRGVYALKSGLWSLTDTWSVSAEPSPFDLLQDVDSVYTNTFTITADISTKVNTIRNSALVPNISAGGSFMLADQVSLSANYGNSTSPITNTVLISSFISTSAEIIGNVSGPQTTGSSCLRHSGTGIIYLSGSVFGVANNKSGANTIDNVSSGNINIVGNLFGGSGIGVNSVVRNLSSGMVYIKGNAFNSLGYNPVILNASTGTVYLTGNVYGHTGGNGTGSGVSNTGTGTVEMVGDAYGNLDPGVRGTKGIIRIYGNCIGSNSISTTTAGGLTLTTTGQAVVYGNVIGTNASSGATSAITTTTPLSVYGNIINAPNGRQAIYAPRYQVFPTGSAQYTRHAVNGYDSFVDYWTADATFSYPPVSSVKLNQTYANSLSSGLMNVPPTSAIAFNSGAGPTNVSITQLIAGERYQITDNLLGADFVRCGAENSNVGTKFTALSAGVGIGRARTLGKATLNTQSIWSIPIVSLSTTQLTMGMILKDAATSPAISAIVSSMNLENY